MNRQPTMRSQRCFSAGRQHWRPGRGFCAASRPEQPLRRRTLDAALLGLPCLLLLPSTASAGAATPRAAAPTSSSGSGDLPGTPPAASLEEAAGGSAGGRPGGRSMQGRGLLEDRAQRSPSEVSEVDGGSDDDSGSESDSSSSSSSSDEEGEGPERRPAARRKQPKAARRMEEQLRTQMEDKRRAKEQEKAAKAARREEERLHKEAEQAQVQARAAAQGGDVAGMPAEGRRHGPSELPYPAAAGDAGMGGDGEEGDKRQLSWLLGQLLQ